MPKKKTVKKKAPAKKAPTPLNLDHIAEPLRPLAVPIAQLELDPANPRTHDQANLAAIAASLLEFGQVKPIVANRRNDQVVAGNGALQAAKTLGWTQIACLYVEYDETTQRGFSIADNRTADLADWDLDILSAQISLIETETPELAAALQLAELQQAADQPADTDAKPDEPMPEHYQVVVDCEDEPDQKAMYEKLQAEGRTCRLLTL